MDGHLGQGELRWLVAAGGGCDGEVFIEVLNHTACSTHSKRAPSSCM